MRQASRSRHSALTSAPANFVDELEGLRVPLTAYCYRLLGSAADSDDAVQETIIRAAGLSDRYDPTRARLTTWVHRIATNICLDMLRSARRRAVATDLGPAAAGPDIGQPLPAERWIEPMPDSRLLVTTDPAERLVERETVRLAFIALLQRLPPRQRAVLVLRDVLSFSAQESADMLDTSVAAANSALQRARATLASSPPEASDVIDPEDGAQRDLLERYIAAFESHHLTMMTELLRADAVTSMPPFPWWLRGGVRIAELTTASGACAEDRLLPTAANGTPAVGQYRPDPSGILLPFALVVIEMRDGQVARTTTFFGSGDRFAEFGLPAKLSRE